VRGGGGLIGKNAHWAPYFRTSHPDRGSATGNPTNSPPPPPTIAEARGAPGRGSSSLPGNPRRAGPSTFRLAHNGPQGGSVKSPSLDRHSFSVQVTGRGMAANGVGASGTRSRVGRAAPSPSDRPGGPGGPACSSGVDLLVAGREGRARGSRPWRPRAGEGLRRSFRALAGEEVGDDVVEGVDQVEDHGRP